MALGLGPAVSQGADAHRPVIPGTAGPAESPAAAEPSLAGHGPAAAGG
jgi:hypothetical protein